MISHLVAYEYGSGQAWGYVLADSPETIAELLPEVDVYYVAPGWFTDADLDEIRGNATVEVDDPLALDHILHGSARAVFALV